MSKLRKFKKRVQKWWNKQRQREDEVENNTAVSSMLSSSQPTITFGAELVIQEPESATEIAQPTSSSSIAEPEEPQSPHHLAGAPAYHDADQFQRVAEEDIADIEKPPPYIDPMGVAPGAPPTVGGAAYVLPMTPSYLPPGDTYPPAYPPFDPTIHHHHHPVSTPMYNCTHHPPSPNDEIQSIV